MIFAVSIFAVL